MKIKISIALILTLTLVGCNDFLEEYPKDGLVLEQYWQNKEDLYNVLSGAYGSMAEMDARLFLNGEIRGDMLAQGRNITNYAGNLNLIMDADILATNSFCTWADFYEVINYCNYVIKYAPIIQQKDNTFSDYYLKASIAEATALRSLMYFYLVRIFRDVPYVTWATESDAVELFPAKTGGDTILNYILEDLLGTQDDNTQLIEQIPEFYGSNESTKGRMNRYAAYAMIADIALWMFDYELALEYIGKIENAGQFILVSNKDWYKQFSEGNQYESIFELQMSTSGKSPNRMFKLTENVANQYFVASNYAENLFLNSDIEKTRKEGTLLADGTADYKVYKYLGYLPSSRSSVGYIRTSTEQGDANFIIYRYADIMLMKAEALSQQAAPDFETALELVNTLRFRANVPRHSLIDFAQSKLTAEEYILEERALELAYEGKRWFDLLRYARRDNYARKEKFISLLIANISPSKRLIVASKLKNTNGWYLPVSQTEIENNPNLKQNSYYVTPDL